MSDEGLTAWQLLYKLWGGEIPDEKQAKRLAGARARRSADGSSALVTSRGEHWF